MKKVFLITAAIIFSSITVLTALTVNSRLKLPYNSEGYYFEEGSSLVYKQQAVEVYGVLAVVSFLLTILFIYFLYKKPKLQSL